MSEPIQDDEKNLLHSRLKIDKRAQGESKLAADDTRQRPRGIELHDDAPEKVTTPRAAIIETEVKGFHLES
jgi:hypothetical protein